jgi:hypothetical protein
MPAAAARWRIMARAFGWGRGLSKCAPHLSRALRSRLFETAGSWDRRRCRFVRDYSPERCRARLRGGRNTQTMYWVEARPNRPRCLAIAGALAAQPDHYTTISVALRTTMSCPATGSRFSFKDSRQRLRGPMRRRSRSKSPYRRSSAPPK